MPEIGASHKTTHQAGGNDEISLTGLTAPLHSTTHQNAGTDEISVAGLSGALADTQTPSAHGTSHQNGEADEISVAGLAGQVLFVPYNGKIADIKEDDTDKHFLNLSTTLIETRTILMIAVAVQRVSGTGNLYYYPNEGSYGAYYNTNYIQVENIIASGTNRLQYSQSVANDDFDLICLGYTVLGT